MSAVVGVALVYFVVVAAIAIWAARRTHDARRMTVPTIGSSGEARNRADVAADIASA